MTEECPYWKDKDFGRLMGPIEHTYAIKNLVGKSDEEYSILICSSCKQERSGSKKETITIGYFYIG